MRAKHFFAIFALVLLVAACVAPPPTPTPVPPTPTPVPPTPTLPQIFEQASKYTVSIESTFSGDKKGTGTGIIFDEDGLIVTNAHVVEGAAAIRVEVQSHGVLTARLVGISPCDDLAVIKVQESKLPVVQFSDSSDLRVGEDVYVFGYPLGQRTPSATRGIVSQLGAKVDELGGLIQTDAAVNPGNSGGPLLNRAGKVVGIITVKAQYDPNSRTPIPLSGIAYAITSNSANRITPELRQGKNRNNVGMNVIPLKDIPNIKFDYGLFVTAVAKDSPADKGHLLTGDILVKLEGVTLKSKADLCDILAAGHSRLSYEVWDIFVSPPKVVKGEIILSEGPVVAAPAPTPTRSVISIFKDDLNSPPCKWATQSDTYAEIGCIQNQLKFSILRAGYISATTVKSIYATFLPLPSLYGVGVSAIQISGSDRTFYGIALRYQDNGNTYYLFAIRGDGQYAILKNVNNALQYNVNWKASTKIKRGLGQKNDIAVAVSSSRMVFFINDDLVEDVDDNLLVGGSIGLAVGTFEGERSTPVIYFDDVDINTVK